MSTETPKTVVIEAGHYEEARRRLMQDSIVIGMADEMRGNIALDKVRHDSGSPRFGFMQAANAEYAKRGGKDGGHLGGVAEALLRLLEEASK